VELEVGVLELYDELGVDADRDVDTGRDIGVRESVVGR
jgi:hypothetical protein